MRIHQPEPCESQHVKAASRSLAQGLDVVPPACPAGAFSLPRSARYQGRFAPWMSHYYTLLLPAFLGRFHETAINCHQLCGRGRTDR